MAASADADKRNDGHEEYIQTPYLGTLMGSARTGGRGTNVVRGVKKDIVLRKCSTFNLWSCYFSKRCKTSVIKVFFLKSAVVEFDHLPDKAMVLEA
jgi:hypothetical protein